MKKFLSLFMSLVMLISITAGLDLTANADVLTGNCGENGSNVIFTFDTETGDLTISGTGKMLDFDSFIAPWNRGDSMPIVKTVIINSGVVNIGDNAFEDCGILTSAAIPDSVTSIGNYAFSGCSSLTGITIPNSVTNIGKYSFYRCGGLTSITIPNSVTSIGECAFLHCGSLLSATIGNRVTSIGCKTFENCSSLTSITIPNGVTSIGDSAFYDCNSLKDVYYSGTEEQWNNIIIGASNENLKNAAIHYNPLEPETPIVPPTTEPETKSASIKVSGTVYKLDKNGDYVSSKVKKPSISKTTKAKKSFKATWKKVSAVSGYQVQYSTSKKFTKKTTKTKTVKGNKSKKPSLTVKKLKSKKTYYVRVRTYKTVKINGKTTKVYSSWSKVKSVKTK